MLKYEFDRENGIVHLRPKGAIEKKDFEAIASEIDPYINEKGKINGLMISPGGFPYWKNFAAMIGHFKFIRGHLRRIKKIAIVSDYLIATIISTIIGSIVNTQVRHFRRDEESVAEAWIKGETQLKAS